jgi:ectoine hydroxylase-related dioxygenase (phytanoyl-CoA dioxygenase family)
MKPSALEEHLQRIARDGFSIMENALDPDLTIALVRDIARLERELGVTPAHNSFEGEKTLRIYNLLVHGEMWQHVPVHPNVLPAVERVLDGGCLISSLSSINILAGESAQPIHADDQLIPVAKPHVPLVCNTMWALTDFTEANGATRVVPGSHLADHSPEYGREYESVAAEMPKGSVLIWHGSLWHGGGANRSGEPRLGVAMNYCAGFIRQQENQQLGIPPRIAAGFSRRLQRLCGYGVYNGLLGHIDKHDPIELLGGSDDTRMIWDADRRPEKPD